MQYPIQIERQNGHYHASVLTVPTLTQTAATRAEVLRLIQAALFEYMQRTEIVYVEIPATDVTAVADHWLATAGSFADDPTLRPMVEEIHATRDHAQQKMQQEITAYYHMHTDLLQHFKGQYVAVHQGQVVDHDAEQLALYLRIRQHYPEEVVLIRQVRPEAEKSWMIRTPKFERE